MADSPSTPLVFTPIGLSSQGFAFLNQAPRAYRFLTKKAELSIVGNRWLSGVLGADHLWPSWKMPWGEPREEGR